VALQNITAEGPEVKPRVEDPPFPQQIGEEVKKH